MYLKLCEIVRRNEPTKEYSPEYPQNSVLFMKNGRRERGGRDEECLRTRENVESIKFGRDGDED